MCNQICLPLQATISSKYNYIDVIFFFTFSIILASLIL